MTSDISTKAILQARPAKSAVDVSRPYALFVEPECAASGEIVDDHALRDESRMSVALPDV